MTPEQLRELMELLRERVRMEDASSRSVRFDRPSAEELVREGVPDEGVRQLMDAPWYPEMIEDVEETPEFCSAAETPEAVLGYARDVITEYLRKRFAL